LLGEIHDRTANTLVMLARIASAREDYPSVESMTLRALNIFRQTVGERHDSYLIAKGNLGIMYLARCQFQKAEEVFRQLLAVRLANPATNRSNVAIVQITLGRTLWRQNRVDEGRKFTKAGLEYLLKHDTDSSFVEAATKDLKDMDTMPSTGPTTKQLADWCSVPKK
jgi:tetratricopeptide (TPR) repeat protein